MIKGHFFAMADELKEHVRMLEQIVVRRMGWPARSMQHAYVDMAAECMRATDVRIRAVGIAVLAYMLAWDDANIPTPYAFAVSPLIAGELIRMLGCDWGYTASKRCRHACRYAMQLDPECCIAYVASAYIGDAVPYIWPAGTPERVLSSGDWLMCALHTRPNFGELYMLLCGRIGLSDDPLLNGAYTSVDILLLANVRDPCNANVYAQLARIHLCWDVDVMSTVRVHDGRSLDAVGLCFAALEQDRCCGDAYGCLYVYMQCTRKPQCACGVNDGLHICIPTIGRMTRDQLALRTVQYGALGLPRSYAIRPCDEPWTPQYHGAFVELHEGPWLDKLFGTLLMAMNRLETAGVLAPSHHSMLEDMLGGWTMRDSFSA